MRLQIWLLLAASILAVSHSASAQDFPKAGVLLGASKSLCAPTPTTITALNHSPAPDAVYSGNNLVQPAGKAEAMAGQWVVVRGRVLDSRCVPVANALVELWQADGQGRYVEFSRRLLAHPQPVFTGSGRTSTNNLGQFEFVTLFPDPARDTTIPAKAKPKKIKKNKKKKAKKAEPVVETPPVPENEFRAPVLHFKVKQNDFKPFATEVFFENDQRNENDRIYRALSANEKEQLSLRVISNDNTALETRIDIVLPGAVPFIKY